MRYGKDMVILRLFLALDNWKVQADIVDRRVYDEQMFREAGHKVPKVTYKFDPTKPISQRRT